MELLVSAIALGVALLQFKFDHFRRSAANDAELDRELQSLGAAIRLLEYALSETVAVLRTRNQGPNAHLADLWQRVSQKFEEFGGNTEVVDITFRKNLYWRDPDSFENAELYEISIENLLAQLRHLREKYDSLLKRRASVS
jgi:hypothetical protein